MIKSNCNLFILELAMLLLNNLGMVLRLLYVVVLNKYGKPTQIILTMVELHPTLYLKQMETLYWEAP